MGHISDSPGLDESRSAPAYGDETGERAIRNLMLGPLTDWKIVGPSLVVRQTENRGLGYGESESMRMPAQSPHAIQLNLMPEVAEAVLKLLLRISEPAPSRSGRSVTYRLKKEAPTVGTAGADSPQ